jgi:predicted TIM-barrel enzyme
LRQRVGPEIVSGMAAVVNAVRAAVDVPLGVQILAGANREALAVALAAGAAFIRAENFVFAHVADEG